jgi:hypothetical protein
MFSLNATIHATKKQALMVTETRKSKALIGAELKQEFLTSGKEAVVDNHTLISESASVEPEWNVPDDFFDKFVSFDVSEAYLDLDVPHAQTIYDEENNDLGTFRQSMQEELERMAATAMCLFRPSFVIFWNENYGLNDTERLCYFEEWLEETEDKVLSEEIIMDWNSKLASNQRLCKAIRDFDKRSLATPLRE